MSMAHVHGFSISVPRGSNAVSTVLVLDKMSDYQEMKMQRQYQFNVFDKKSKNNS